eukprot:CAMPEP_0185741516 /NCGR_PEP_ID=MMETSP1171-20130828/39002_1 /TAXON_ID=374046 /ORGANISM="Helicotheca tamensis, Strain CCMP826" /LENGTH=715 /DNA_ID=CAMNT_0028413495 /DNA_START=49 /DNA_END=2196 /DNA_ORIENTATION=-
MLFKVTKLFAALLISGLYIPSKSQEVSALTTFEKQSLETCGTPYAIQLGSDLTKPSSSLALSQDGKVIALGGISGNTGHVRIMKFEDDLSTWVQLGEDIDGEAANYFSGRSISLSSDGHIVAIGAHRNGGGGFDSGHVRVYQYDGTATWNQLGQDIDGEAASDYSGVSVSLSSDGHIVAIGAHWNDGGGPKSGHVRVYQYDGTATWNQLGQDIDGEAADDRSGRSVSLSSDGHIVAIAANRNNGGGSESGHVRVYQYDGTATWNQLGQDIDGEAADDLSGKSISLSSDGHIVAIGAGWNDGGGFDSGHVRVYQYDGTATWNQLGKDIDGDHNDDLIGRVSISGDGNTIAVGAQEYAKIFTTECINIENMQSFGISDPVMNINFDSKPPHDGPEIIMSYNLTTPIAMTNKAFSIQISEEGCNDYYNDYSQYINVSSTKLNGIELAQNNYNTVLQGTQMLNVYLDIKQGAITNSPFFTFTDSPLNSTAKITFCQLLMLSNELDNDSDLPTGNHDLTNVAAFQQTNINIDLDFSQMFTLDDIDIGNDPIVEIHENANIEAGLHVFLCDATSGDDLTNAHDNKIIQNSKFSLCFTTNSTNVGIHGVHSLTFSQEDSGIAFNVITDGKPNSITTTEVDSTTPIPNKGWMVTTHLIPSFFLGSLGGADHDVTASGSVVMKYQDDTIGRRLYLRRSVHEDVTVNMFDIKLGLANKDGQPSND